MARPKKANPRITWEDNTWSVSLPMDDGRLLNARWQPALTYVIRIREAGTEPWSFGFETPIPGCTFVDLKPDTEYELQVRTRNAAGEGEPASFRIRTNRSGHAGNVIPFPKR